MIEALEKEKSEMNARVALMERKDLYKLLEAKMEGFQIANHPRTIGGFKNLNLTRKWVEIPVLNLEEFEKFFDYMRSIFDSYVNPTNNPNVQPLVKGLDADDFSVDKFFGLQDPTSPDDVQASLDFEENLRTNEHLRLRVEFPKDHDPEAIFHVLRTILCFTMPIDPALVQTGIMNIERQQDGHSCGKHLLQMLARVGVKESEGLDRCFREEGLRYIATLE
ncbi:hypothetical protein R1flu_027106 [Riccia fluitans]|uniref:Uncharacterized protein n=1 Tax=Riccia fluitans TaxID=41844 RepID=A0ABD1XLY5_9MARC